jgi:Ca-activated chloride channel family protein
MMESSIDDREARLSDRSADIWRELGPWLLLLALPLAALSFRRGLVWLVPLYLVVLPPDAQAFDWQTLWQNNDQRAHELFENGDHKTAAELFDSSPWQASSNYRAGDYAAALEAWQQLDGDEAGYNRANTLAKLGRYEEALANYQQLLEQNPTHEDARYNKEALEEWLKNQPQQQQQQDQSQQQQQQQDEQSRQQDQQQGNQSRQQQSESGEAQENESQQPTEDTQNQADNSDKEQQQSAQQTTEQEQEALEDEALAELDQKMTDQAAEQWLRKIPDDPGGLLRRKFLYQYRQRGGADAEAQSW